MIAILCKSDSNGGAAVVSRRLTEALRRHGHDAVLLVEEKLTDLPYVQRVGNPLSRFCTFIAERLQIFLHNGFSRRNLFKVDTAAFGLPLYLHPAVKKADVVVLNWVNQGMLSLKGVRKIAESGKKIVWIMHDMWNFTGICHHSMECRNFTQECGDCFLLGKDGGPHDLSAEIHRKKVKLYDETDITFVAVSNWLADRARQSTLLRDRRLSVIHNPFDILPIERKRDENRPSHRILFAAAGLDNWIKGLDTFREAVNIFARNHPDLAADSEVVLMGSLKDPASISGFSLPVDYLGSVNGDRAIAEAFAGCDVVVNASRFENLPGTLIEGQAYGAVPVAFDRGGQSDIISHLSTGFLAQWDEDYHKRAENLAEGIFWALSQVQNEDNGLNLRKRMKKAVEEKFSYEKISSDFIKLFETIVC